MGIMIDWLLKIENYSIQDETSETQFIIQGIKIN